ncbi:hypothetical protein [Methylocystis parvus]
MKRGLTPGQAEACVFFGLITPAAFPFSRATAAAVAVVGIVITFVL